MRSVLVLQAFMLSCFRKTIRRIRQTYDRLQSKPGLFGYVQGHQRAMVEPFFYNLLLTAPICRVTHLFPSAMRLASFPPFPVYEVKHVIHLHRVYCPFSLVHYVFPNYLIFSTMLPGIRRKSMNCIFLCNKSLQNLVA